MNTIRRSVEVLFESPIQNMSFVAYLSNVNSAGKITARSLMDLSTLCLTYIEELEKKNEQYEANFKEIEHILTKLVNNKTQSDKIDITPNNYSETKNTTTETAIVAPPFQCTTCSKAFTTKLALMGHGKTHLSKK